MSHSLNKSNNINELSESDIEIVDATSSSVNTFSPTVFSPGAIVNIENLLKTMAEILVKAKRTWLYNLSVLLKREIKSETDYQTKLSGISYYLAYSWYISHSKEEEIPLKNGNTIQVLVYLCLLFYT
jgi:hypothetical protein